MVVNYYCFCCLYYNVYASVDEVMSFYTREGVFAAVVKGDTLC